MFTFNLSKQLAKVAVAAALMAIPASAQDTRTVPKEFNQPQFQISPTNQQAAAAAPAFTPWSKITALQAGWVVDRMLVFLDTPGMTNPGNECPLITNGYIINEADSGRNVFYTMLISALVSGRQVQLVISGCFADRPRIISVVMR